MVTRWWLDLPVHRKGLCVVAIPLVALLAVSGTTLVLVMLEREQRAAALESRTVATAAQAVLDDAIGAETGVRGYVATRQPVFLQPYEVALDRLPGDLRTLSAVGGAASGPIEATATEQFALLARVRADPSASTAARLAEGKAVMDRLRRQVADFTAGPQLRFADRLAAIRQVAFSLLVITLVGLGLGLLAGLVGMRLFTAGIAARLRIAADNADRLGRGQPPTPMAPARDELGRLATALDRAAGLLAVRHEEMGDERDAAVRATTAKNTFLSRTSHELRTPLNAILGFGQLLELSELSERDRDGVTRIVAAGRHLLALINELLDISRIEAGDLNLSLEPVGVGPLITDVTDLIGPLAAAREIRVRSVTGPDGLAVRADNQRLRQILINLASNAVKYNVRGGTIDVTARTAADDTVEICVADSGLGISDADLEQVFMPFERLGAEARGIEGSGIGLPLARSLAEAMGGTLTATSTTGRGSTFTVRLPRAVDVAPAPAPAAVEAPRPAGRPRTDPIVVVSIEDNPANSEVIARYFAARPAVTLHAATSGPEGLEVVRSHRPDVILLDLHLPGLSGEEVLDRLQADAGTAAIPVIVLSADATGGTARSLRARGVSAYLTKPVDLAELGAAVDAAVRPDPGTVLYIDDEPNNIVLVEALLDDRPEVRLVSATRATDGLELARREHPRLILLDRRLPDLTGNEVLRRLKDSPDTAAIPVVMLSGDSGREQAAALIEQGAAGFLEKPFEIDELLRIVDRYAGS